MTERRGHALVIGASSGIGFALAERLAPTMHVTALARRLDRMAPLAELGATPVAQDVCQFDGIATTVKDAVAQRGKFSAMIYCAGMQRIKAMRSTGPAEIQSVLDTNLAAPLVFASLFASRLVTLDDAVFCGVSSIAAQRPEPGIIAYSAAKAGLDAMIKGLAREAAPRRAVAVAPGWLDTEMTQSHSRVYDDAFKERLKASAPGGIAAVEDIVNAICFLISPGAARITGITLTVDAGASL